MDEVKCVHSCLYCEFEFLNIRFIQLKEAQM